MHFCGTKRKDKTFQSTKKGDTGQFEEKMRTMLREKDSDFSLFHKLLSATKSNFQEISNEKQVIDSIKRILKDKSVSYEQKFIALLFLKELVETKEERIISYIEGKLLRRLEKMTAKNGWLMSYLAKPNKAIDQKEKGNFRILLLECLATWAAFGTQYREVYRRLLKKGAMHGIDILKPRFYHQPEHALINLRNRMLEQLLTEKVDLYNVRKLLEEFDSIFHRIEETNKADVNLFLGVKELISRSPLSIPQIYAFLRNWAASDHILIERIEIALSKIPLPVIHPTIQPQLAETSQQPSIMYQPNTKRLETSQERSQPIPLHSQYADTFGLARNDIEQQNFFDIPYRADNKASLEHGNRVIMENEKHKVDQLYQSGEPNKQLIGKATNQSLLYRQYMDAGNRPVPQDSIYGLTTTPYMLKTDQNSALGPHTENTEKRTNYVQHYHKESGQKLPEQPRYEFKPATDWPSNSSQMPGTGHPFVDQLNRQISRTLYHR